MGSYSKTVQKDNRSVIDAPEALKVTSPNSAMSDAGAISIVSDENVNNVSLHYSSTLTMVDEFSDNVKALMSELINWSGGIFAKSTDLNEESINSSQELIKSVNSNNQILVKSISDAANDSINSGQELIKSMNLSNQNLVKSIADNSQSLVGSVLEHSQNIADEIVKQSQAITTQTAAVNNLGETAKYLEYMPYAIVVLIAFIFMRSK